MASCTTLSILKGKSRLMERLCNIVRYGFVYFIICLPNLGPEILRTYRGNPDVFKRLLFLPRNTSGAVLRLKVELVKVFCRTIRLTWDWFIRILKMGDKSLPKICMMRLVNLAESLEAENRYNWAIQFTFLPKQTLLISGALRIPGTLRAPGLTKRRRYS